MGVENIISLVTGLLQLREANRLHVLDKCFLPLKQAVSRLHSGYLERFGDYERKLTSGEVDRQLLNDLSADVRSVLADRSEVLLQAETLRQVAASRVGDHDNLLSDMVAALQRYLFSPQLKMELTQARLAFGNNPNYHKIVLALEDGGRQAALATIKKVVDSLVQNYSHWQQSAAAYEAFLCR
jgi:hypothetical protein